MCDFFLRGHLKANLYREKPGTPDESKAQIRNPNFVNKWTIIGKSGSKYLERLEICVCDNNSHSGDVFFVNK